MKLYLGSPVRVQSLLLMLALAGFIIASLVRRETVERWGWRILVLAAAGLVLCTLAAARDGYHLSVQNAIDGSVAAGLFNVKSVQSVICCISGGVIVLAGLSALFVPHHTTRGWGCGGVSAAFTVKVLTIEVSRVILHLQG